MASTPVDAAEASYLVERGNTMFHSSERSFLTRVHAAAAGCARNLISALTAVIGGAAPAGRSAPCHHHGRTGLHEDLTGNTSAQVLPVVVQANTGAIPA